MTTDTETVPSALLETEASFQLLFHQHPLPMWVVENQSLAFLAVNEAALHAYGFSREEFLAMTMDQIAEPDEEQGTDEPAGSTSGMKAAAASVGSMSGKTAPF